MLRAVPNRTTQPAASPRRTAGSLIASSAKWTCATVSVRPALDMGANPLPDRSSSAQTREPTTTGPASINGPRTGMASPDGSEARRPRERLGGLLRHSEAARQHNGECATGANEISLKGSTAGEAWPLHAAHGVERYCGCATGIVGCCRMDSHDRSTTAISFERPPDWCCTTEPREAAR